MAEKKEIKDKFITLEDMERFYKTFQEKTDELLKLAVNKDGTINKTYVEKDSSQGYDTTGYKYQRLVNIMNDVVGSSHWRSKWTLIDKSVTQDRYGNDRHSLAFEVTVLIGNPMPGGDFEIIDEKTCFGSMSSKKIGDGYKGAYTNGLKKTFALFGLGSNAYTGELHYLMGLPIPLDEGEDDEETSTPAKTQTKKETVSTDVEYVCSVSGEKITAKQAQYCKERGWKPTSYGIITKYREEGRLKELEAENGEK